MRDPEAPGEPDTGYAESYGCGWLFTQRVYWEGDWKLVFNGFDWDELYGLASDPFELRNLAREPDFRDKHVAMTRALWREAGRWGDDAIRYAYPPARLGEVGPHG